MHQPRKLRLTVSVILCFLLQAQGADKYTDENRPYEFGFKIDGQQHRHESKDKDGIIMGEFGFITADDVYHVTVYATDKEGRFKILSMKNIHLKSSPASSPRSPTSSRQGHALALPPAQPASVQAAAAPQVTPAQQSGKPFKALEPPGKSCSSCSLPPTTTQAPLPVYNLANENGNYNSEGKFGAPGSTPQNQQAFPLSSAGQPDHLQAGLGGSSFPHGGQPGSSSQNQQTFPPSSAGQPNNLQAGLGGSSFSQGGQPGYFQQGPAISQNYPQQASGIRDGASTYAQQPGLLVQNYPSSPSYAQGPSAPNSPSNYAQPEISSQFGQSPENARQQPGAPQDYPGEQSSLSGGDNGPYAQSGSTGLTGSQGGLSGPNAQLPGGSISPQGAGGRTSKQYNGPEQQFNSNVEPNVSQGPGFAPGGQPGSAKPTLVSAQMQIVDKNTDIHSLRPGEKEGLPPGLTKDDMTQLLYTFNYTVGFHGHFEEGYTNGVKKGYYYVTGRNGVRTRIDYVADDTGFHPKVSQDVLDLLSDDVPKPETEKDAKFGLKGYEFKWLYYPVDSKRR